MTSKESFEAYEVALKERDPREEEYRERWKVSSEKEKLEIIKEQNKWKKEHDAHVRKAISDLIPEVGTKCTVIYYSDRRAATVTRIVSSIRIAVRHNKTKCLNYYGGKYEILPELEGGEEIFTKRRNGLWVMEGHKSRDGVILSLTHQSHYIDPHF